MLWRYNECKGREGSADDDLSFADAAKVSQWAILAVKWTCGDGVIIGKTDGSLDPLGNSTRDEAAAMIHRYLKK